MIFTLLAETGLRPVEASNLTLRDVDLEGGILTVKSAKHGNPRTFKLKASTLVMLNTFLQRLNPKINQRIFPSSSAIRHSFIRYRNFVAEKLHEPEIQKIRLYDLRHYYATMLYHKTKDILYVKQQLGHKRLENTLVYTHLVDFRNEEFVCRLQRLCKKPLY